MLATAVCAAVMLTLMLVEIPALDDVFKPTGLSER
jgi:hypothetical protein